MIVGGVGEEAGRLARPGRAVRISAWGGTTQALRSSA
jgi:hypothetical protein